jgi:hypothetical protein
MADTGLNPDRLMLTVNDVCMIFLRKSFKVNIIFKKGKTNYSYITERNDSQSTYNVLLEATKL